MLNGNKPKINLAIDALMMILLKVITGFGFLIKYILLTGSESKTIYGRDVELFFLDLTDTSGETYI